MTPYQKFRKGYKEVIEINRLNEGKHIYRFDLRDNFLDDFSRDYLQEIQNTKVEVQLNKTSSMIEATIKITSQFPLKCDRCTSDYIEDINANEKIIYYFEEKKYDTSDTNLRFISKNEDFIDLGQEIYDMLCLSVPIKKECKSDTCETFIEKYSLKSRPKKTDERFKELLDLFPPENK